MVVRKAVVDLVDKARTEKYAKQLLVSCRKLTCQRKLRSSLEADILLNIPKDAQDSRLASLLQSQRKPVLYSSRLWLICGALESFLGQLFIVSEVSLNPNETQVGEWEYSELIGRASY